MSRPGEVWSIWVLSFSSSSPGSRYCECLPPSHAPSTRGVLWQRRLLSFVQNMQWLLFSFPLLRLCLPGYAPNFISTCRWRLAFPSAFYSTSFSSDSEHTVKLCCFRASGVPFHLSGDQCHVRSRSRCRLDRAGVSWFHVRDPAWTASRARVFFTNRRLCIPSCSQGLTQRWIPYHIPLYPA